MHHFRAVNKIPLSSPVKLISEELHYFLWDTALQVCHRRPSQLWCLHSKCKNGHFVLVGWSGTPLTPLGFPSRQNFLLKGAAISSGCEFCFVPLWICLAICRVKGESKGAQTGRVFCKLYPMESLQGLETPTAGGRGKGGWEQQTPLQATQSASFSPCQRHWQYQSSSTSNNLL